MARQEIPRIPKVREYAQIELSDGSVMNGYVFVEATLRIQDLLNSATPFIPFVDECVAPPAIPIPKLMDIDPPKAAAFGGSISMSFGIRAP